ncbi:undecaprenyl-diphosphate phosphatase [Salinispira pacifica]|uniref:Undecaprenyl-diphosphatase n=1 Tax=Salinispira pacifica TaxID=1307761 RepID=V5WEV5_9SPIO|nr:undecaprenyl-diphosphate phosphatase [Salinispira pacifica]AHC13701.1 Undecaprenyl-diphosphatase [Salinispira pacifica]
MTALQAAAFGLIQGLTEFLPVSSSGHLALLKSIWGFEDVSILFDVLLHVATLAAVLIVFRKRIWKLILSLLHGIRGRADEGDRMHLKLILMLLLATVITAVLGIGIDEMLQPASNIKLVSLLFIVTAGILILSSRVKPGNKGYKELGVRESIITGVAQGMGVFAGISRSGITISAGIFAGLKREEAGEFSFLLAIPAILGAAILKIPELGDLQGSIGGLPLILGISAAFFSGLISLILLMKLVRSGKLHYFSLYLIPLGIAGLIFL